MNLKKHLIFISLISILIGCSSSYNKLQPIRNSLYNKNYQRAIEIYDSLDITDKNAEALDHANRGLLLHLAERFTESNEELEVSENYMDRIFENNFKEIAASYIINEYSLPYGGEDYENIMINFYKLFNYLLLNDPQEALVECRRIDHKLNVLSDCYSNSQTYTQDAFARYISGIIYESLGNFNDAFIDYFKAYQIYNSLYKEKYNTTCPDNLKHSLLRCAFLSNRENDYDLLKNELNMEFIPLNTDSLCEVIIIIETGELPHKEEINSYIPLEDDKVIAISLPTIIPHPSSIIGGYICSSKSKENIELVEDLGSIAIISLEDHRGRIILRAIARAALKVLALEAGEEIGDQLSNENNSLLGNIIGIGINIFGAATEHADLRCWSLLPDKIFLGRIFVEPNENFVELNLILNKFNNEKIIYKIEPENGKTIFIKDRFWY